MKKIVLAFAALSLLFASCKKEDLGKIDGQEPAIEESGDVLTTFTTPAGPETGTKVAYGYSVDLVKGWTVTKTWEVGDKLVGIIDDYIVGTDSLKYFTFECTEIKDNVATWTRKWEYKYSIPETPKKGYTGKLYMVSGESATAKLLSAGGNITFASSIEKQTNDTPQCVTCGIGTLKENDSLVVNFENKMALLVLNDLTFPGKTSGAVKEIRIEGVNTNGTIKVDTTASPRVFVFTGKKPGTITLMPATSWAIGTDGKFSKNDTLFVGIPTGTNLKNIVVRAVFDDDAQYTYSVATDAVINTQLYRIKEKSFSSVNVAQIGTTPYSTLASAFQAANDSESDVTVELLCDAYSAQSQIIKNTNSAKVTFDLHGYKFTSSAYPSISTETDCVIYGKTANSTADVTAIRCTNGTLTINGGNYVGDYKTQGIITVNQKTDGNAQIIIDNASNPTVTSGGQAALFANGGKMTIASGTFKNTKEHALYTYGVDTVCISGGSFETTGDSYAVQAHSPSTHSGNNGLVQIDGGTFKSTSKYTIYSGRNHNLTINGGEFVGDTCLCFQGYTTGKVQLLVNGGYFYTNNPTRNKCIGSSNAKVQAGYFNTTVEKRNIASNTLVCNELSSPVSYKGREYDYQIETFAGKMVEVKIGDDTQQYDDWASGLVAAKEASSNATIKLLNNVALTESTDFTNSNGKDVTLDLNNYTLSSSGVRNMIKTTGVLNITDESRNKAGMVTGSVNRVIYLTTSGTINISNCTIETSGENYKTTIDSSAIVVHGTSTGKAAQLNINNATIRTAKDKRTSLFGIQYATVKIENSVITESSTGAGYYMIKTNSGASVKITNTSMYTPANSNIHSMGASGSASITVNNCWFFTGGNSNFSTSSEGTYDSVITAGKSYFNKNTRTAYSNWKVATGQSWSTESPAVSHNHPGVGDLNYGYSIK